MTPQAFIQMLEELDSRAAAEHSTVNHHVNGMHYLCLHRSERMTVKIYIIDSAQIGRVGQYLVAPHTHRYAFETTVLAGSIEHIRFAENWAGDAGQVYDRFIYIPEDRRRIEAGARHLETRERHTFSAGGTYWNSSTDIHTIAPTSDQSTVLGLVQFADQYRKSTVYLEPGAEMKYPKSYTPRPVESEYLRRLALDLIHRNA